MFPDRWSTATAALKLSARLVQQIQAAVTDDGYLDVTPLHGFAFARIAAGNATTADLAHHLGISKQAAAQLTERLVAAGYVERRPHPADRRARILNLTARGIACTHAARTAAEKAVDQWRSETHPDAEAFESALHKLTASIVGLRPPL